MKAGATLLGAVLMLGSASCSSDDSSPATAPTPGRHVAAFTRLLYSGRWERVRGRHDGRYLGGSLRSYRSGDALTLVYDGDMFQVFGVVGSNGGRCRITIPGQPPQTADFYSPIPITHQLVYTSPNLGPGLHSATIVVTDAKTGGSGYVNVDEIRVLTIGTDGASVTPIEARRASGPV